ncbi:hypothetical protein J437_LFUL001767 [Ladona fulva]|uniref:Craniofacial development protein 2-like n=1 Tax=Ladona fulva TaxID=123851 RepID=A0A8K0JVX1_LADFU|nr:hypothetical protein J437_LFUL001767 [Ladona fulva]
MAKELAESYKVYYCGTKNGRNGVRIILDKELREEVYEVDRKSDWIMAVKLKIGGSRATIVCSYAPQVGCEVEEKDAFWRDLDQVVAGIPEEERVLVGADLNGQVRKRGSGEERVRGDWGDKERGAEGERIVEHAVANDFAISGRNICQIDYIMCRRKHLKEVRNCKVINGENVAPQHRLLVAGCDIKIGKRMKRKCIRPQKIKWWKLKEEGPRDKFVQKVLLELKSPVDVQEWWEVNIKTIKKIGEEVLGKRSGKGAPPEKETWWWGEEVQNKIKGKREA